MRTIHLYILFFFVVAITSCEKKFLDKKPLNQISEPEFWKTATDLETYLNNLYGFLPGWPTYGGGPSWEDNNSDNMAPGLYDLHLAGLTTLPITGGGWNWTNVRSANIFIANAPKVVEGGLKNHYLGEGYFFRAWFYFELFKIFGELPIIDKPLETNSEELYEERQQRNIVADFILSDIDKAISLLNDKEATAPNRIHRSIALAFKSRVALYEGTWEKYHDGTVFGAENSDPVKYLQMAVSASQTLIDEGRYQIFNEGNPEKDYSLLFNQSDLSNNPEIMFWKKYKLGLLSHNGQRFLAIIAGNTGVTKSLVESYLCTDGLPISSSPLYKGDNGLNNVVSDRDPRLHQIIFAPGDPITIDFQGGGDTLSTFVRAAVNTGGEARDVTGYQIKKAVYPEQKLQQVAFESTTAYTIFRYAEILLNYAEAKAELGEISQGDVDISINKLRARAGMPALNISSIATDNLWQFSELSPVINEIRRERRVELACEGYRRNDLFRWRAHHVFANKRPKGVKFVAADYPANTNITLDDNGYIDPYKGVLPTGYQFNPDRDYLFPLPAYELSLNEKLSQNPNWPRK